MEISRLDRIHDRMSKEIKINMINLFGVYHVCSSIAQNIRLFWLYE